MNMKLIAKPGFLETYVLPGVGEVSKVTDPRSHRFGEWRAYYTENGRFAGYPPTSHAPTPEEAAALLVPDPVPLSE